jgi:hypothetical protein
VSEAISKQSKKQNSRSSSINVDTVSQAGALTQPQEKSQSQWKLETPEYVLLIVIALILWPVGFIELLNRTSTNPTIFGLYSTSYFLVLVAYTLGFGVWIGLLARPSHSGWLTKSVTTIQRNPWLAALSLGTIALLISVLINARSLTALPLSRLGEMPVVSFVFVILLLIVGAVIIFGGWTQATPIQPWRKTLAIFIGGVLLIELILQVLAAANFLPGTQKIADLFVPYGRVYYEGEGFANGRFNNYGWYYPDFNPNDEARRILLTGDTFIQALQISPEQHLGVLLGEMISNDVEEAQVMALGYPGFGPGLYLDIAVLAYPLRSLNPDEIVVVMQLGSDLDNSTLPSDSNIYFELDERGNAKVHPDNFKFWHDLAHYVIIGFQRLDPLQVLEANYLTPKLFGTFNQPVANRQLSNSDDAENEIVMPGFKAVVTEWGPSRGLHTNVKATALVETPGASNYLFESQPGLKAKEALTITKSLIKLANDFAVTQGLTFRLVTIPTFPKSFYQEYEDESWRPEIGNLDLFGPDRELQAFAKNEDIPFLSMGQLMYDKNLPSDEIKTFYFSDGAGHLTPAGHQFLAEAIYACFYANQETSTAGEVGHNAANTTACVN